MRALWPALTKSDQEADRAYALDVIIIELIYIIGPLLVAAGVAVASPTVSVFIAAAFIVLGTLWFASSPPSRTWRGEAGLGHHSALTGPGMLLVVSVILVWSLTFGVLDVAVPAFAVERQSPAAAGFLLACFAIGSTAGGLWYGSRNWRKPQADRLVLAVLFYTLGLFPLLWAQSTIQMIPLMIVAGLGLAPVATSVYRLLPMISPPGRLTEAYAWLETSLAVGLGVGAALSGPVVERFGSRWALATGIAASTLSLIVAAAGRNNLNHAQRRFPGSAGQGRQSEKRNV
jgi:MFS family permease